MPPITSLPPLPTFLHPYKSLSHIPGFCGIFHEVSSSCVTMDLELSSGTWWVHKLNTMLSLSHHLLTAHSSAVMVRSHEPSPVSG